MQTSSRILMVRPARFAFNEATAANNFFQRKRGQERVEEGALEEFDAYVSLLRSNDVEVFVMQDTPEPSTPDAIFPNNWFSSHLTGELVLYPMFAENRRLERKPHLLDFLRRRLNHTKLIDLTPWEEKGEFLEGTGSMVFDRVKRVAYCCRSSRTSEKVLAEFSARMNFDPVVFDAVDRNGNPVYHTNVMMGIGTQVAVVCLEAIGSEGDRNKVTTRLHAAGKVIVEISVDQMEQFAGNMLELKSRNGTPLMVMSATARKSLSSEQEKIISTYNKILSPELTTIETNGGGSARCMIAELFH